MTGRDDDPRGARETGSARPRVTPRRACLVILALLALFGASEAPVASAQILDERASRNRAFADAVAAFKLGNYATALDAFGDLAEAGDVAAQYNLGWMRAKGLGAPMDLVAAYQWFGLVARAGQEKGRQSLAEVRALLAPAEIAEGERRIRAFQAREN